MKAELIVIIIGFSVALAGIILLLINSAQGVFYSSTEIESILDAQNRFLEGQNTRLIIVFGIMLTMIMLMVTLTALNIIQINQFRKENEKEIQDEVEKQVNENVAKYIDVELNTLKSLVEQQGALENASVDYISPQRQTTGSIPVDPGPYSLISKVFNSGKMKLFDLTELNEVQERNSHIIVLDLSTVTDDEGEKQVNEVIKIMSKSEQVLIVYVEGYKDYLDGILPPYGTPANSPWTILERCITAAQTANRLRDF